MGTNELWPASEEARQVTSLRKIFANLRKNQSNAERQRPIPIGIDASIWINACQAIANTRELYVHRSAPVLETLFTKLAFFLHYPVHPLLVFDGPGRPPIKRGKKVITSPDSVVQELKNLLPLFGFSWHDAPGEAEAELARMTRVNHLHSVFTTDSDTLVFHARRVIRTDLDTSHDGDKVSLFELDDLMALGLTEGGLLLFALVLGGDYHNGLDGCGKETALGLARAGFGDSLLQAIRDQNLVGRELDEFLVGWRNGLQRELMSNSTGLLSRRNFKAAGNIDASFPDMDICNAYLHPNVSALPYPRLRLYREPSISDLAKFCQEKLGWSTDKILTWSRNHLWSGVFSQMLYSAFLFHEGSPMMPLLRTPSLSVQLSSISKGPRRKAGDLDFVRFGFSSFDFDELTGIVLDGREADTVKISVAKDFVPAFLYPRKSSREKKVHKKEKGREKPGPSCQESSSQPIAIKEESPSSPPPLRSLSRSPSLPASTSLMASFSIDKKRSFASEEPEDDDIFISGPWPAPAPSEEHPEHVRGPEPDEIDLTKDDDEGGDGQSEDDEEEVKELLGVDDQDAGSDDQGEVEFVCMGKAGKEIIELL